MYLASVFRKKGGSMKWLTFAAVAALVGSLVPGAASATDEASTVRGGRLYDHWSREARIRPPSEAHPLLAVKKSGLTNTDTWRCVACHGWDYQGSNGFVGIRASHGKDTATILAVLKNPSHRYDELMRERDLIDIANFVSKGQINTLAVTDAVRRTNPAAASSTRLYSTVCANCHGANGSQLREVSPLGDSARQRPLEVMHVLMNGHPGGDMPALSALGSDMAARVLVNLQTLPTLDMAASIVHGGRLYDNWQQEAKTQRQALPHPAYPRSGFYANDASLTWRCTACHGWDYLGSQGDYATGRHATGIKGIRAMAGADPARIGAVLRDATHRYDAVLKQRDLLDLANFVSAGQMDMDVIIDRKSRRVNGDAVRGSAYFRTLCVGCHGPEGQSAGSPPLGREVRANPWSALHTLMNGHPDEKMPALRELDRQVLIDLLTHTLGLPDTR